jgi:hypothetical protein
MHVHIRLFPICQESSEVFKRPSVAVDFSILPGYQKISQVEIFFHEKGKIDCGNGEEEVGLIFLHLFDELLFPLDESQYKLQG